MAATTRLSVGRHRWVVQPADRREPAERFRRDHPVLVIDEPKWAFDPVGWDGTWNIHLQAGPTFTSRVRVDGLDPPGPGTAPVPRAAQIGLGRMLAVVDALSYWKAAVPRRIEARFALPGDANFWDEVVAGSMAEFLWTNGLDPGWLPHLATDFDGPLPEPEARAPGRRTAVLLHSGGKDSAAAAEILSRHRWSVVPATVNPTAESAAVVAAGAPSGGWGGGPVAIDRSLDGRLLDLNRAGYLNGHTPVSAWLAVAGLAVAETLGATRVAAGNSASDDAPNLTAEFDGQPWAINHQWSKSAQFERALARVTGPHRCYASPLRSLLETAVVAAVIRHDPARADTYLACNRSAAAGQPGGWCGRCPKCLWTALVIEALAGPAAVVARIGADPLVEVANADLVAALCGRRGPVPFECAGQPAEVRAAVRAAMAANPHRAALSGLEGGDLDDPLSLSVASLVAVRGAAPLLEVTEATAADEWARSAASATSTDAAAPTDTADSPTEAPVGARLSDGS
ncbi:MAG: hypothetical protein ACT4OS_08470 [Acidimicrobiales bacterium]